MAASTSQPVRFVLDGEVVELADVDPTRTVLQFLREDLGRCGTKEGCAEGDCGACTVVVLERDATGENVSVRAVNACIQFLATLDGKELVTVESLAENGLHPVQRAMVDCHGSQCGFCTPGFVMSLFALYKTTPAPSRREIDDALAGNLCRCTGYRPIIDAARKMYEYEGGDDWLESPAGHDRPPAGRLERLASIDHAGSLATGRDGRRFYAPASLAELSDLCARHPDATLLAGGTDVGLWVTKAMRVLDTVIHVGRVPELGRIVVDDTHIELGAAVTFTGAMPVLVEHFPEIEELLLRFASPPIRNAATIGGNVANGSPIGDSMPALMALGATLVLRSAEGERTLPLDAFYHDYMVNDLGPGEFVEALRIPLRAAGTLFRCYKVSKRFDQDISAVCGAFALEFDGDRVARARIAYGGLAATVRRASSAEAALSDRPFDDAAVRAAMDALAQDFEPIGDMRATADYRLRVAQNLLRRLALEHAGEPRVSVYGYGRTA